MSGGIYHASAADHVGILIQVCNAVELAHSHGIVRRDLKPSNVTLGRYGDVYVVDWGLAVTTRDEDARLPHVRDIPAEEPPPAEGVVSAGRAAAAAAPPTERAPAVAEPTGDDEHRLTERHAGGADTTRADPDADATRLDRTSSAP